MNLSLYQAASALNANSRWQEVITENMASSSLPGYKKQEISVAAEQAGLLPASAASNLPQHFALPKAESATSFAPGEMKFTGVDTDLAIDGSAFFEVQLPNGNRAYTRNGEFHLDAQGQLVTKEGYLVLSDSGPVQMDLRNTAPLSVSSSGVISQGADEKGKLNLVEVNNPQALTQVGGGYFLANNPNVTAIPSEQATVRQGYLEGSNTTSISEMVNLMTAMRNFEANQRMIQIQDEQMGRAIRDLSPAS